MSGNEPDAAGGIRRRDEILQMMFWLRGEGFQAEVAPGDLLRFFGADPDDALERSIHDDLRKLAADGLLEEAGEERYRLTDRGMAEGGRRFDDEFSDLRGPAGHGQCDDPDCFCRTDPERALECRGARERRG